MIRRDDLTDIDKELDLSYIGPSERLMFFDIETTGLRAGRAELYLIGLLLMEEDGWHLRQWFSQSMEDEEAMLLEFSELIRERGRRHSPQRPILLSYNGDGFDLPFISSCLRAYDLPDITKNILSFDIYKRLRGIKPLLGIRDLKLKTVERFLGMEREDRYGGGELIPVYEEYRRLYLAKEDEERQRELLTLLLLHNAEDITDLPGICDMLAYESLLEGGFSLSSAQTVDIGGTRSLDLRYRLSRPLPRELYLEDETFTLSASGEEKDLLNIAVRLYEGELRYFFADYKNYYYLPMEDRAIHRSVGEFVERSKRKPATRQNCYERRQGLFLPEPEIIFAPVLYREYKGDTMYAELREDMLEDGERLLGYGASVLRYLQSKINAQRKGKM